MDWLTVLAVADFVFGSGAIVMIFMAGRRIGQLEEQIEVLKKRANPTEAEVKNLISEAENALLKVIHDLEVGMGEDLNLASQAIHRRVDTFNELIGATKHEAGQTAEAIRGMRREWDQLSAELRQLLRSEGATTAEVNLLKERLHIADQRFAELIGKLTALESILREVQRRQDRK